MVNKMTKLRIDSINANNIGPIQKKLGAKLGDVSLFYGKNEEGKTFLVEAILQAMYKTHAQTRAINGQINLEISDGSERSTKFTLHGKDKLEDIFFSNLPKQLDLSRLSVVKGGELSFEKTGGNSISADTLKSYLSDPKKIGKLEKKRNASGIESLLGCKIEHGELTTGRNMGEVKKYNDALQELRETNDLISRINEDDSYYLIQQYSEELATCEKSLKTQEQAKAYKAFTLQRQQANLQAELAPINITQITTAEQKFELVENKTSKIAESVSKNADTRAKTKEIAWIQQAVTDYELLGKSGRSGKFIFPWVIAFLLLLATAASVWLFPQGVSLGLVVVALLTSFWMLAAYRSDTSNSGSASEMKRILDEASKKFGKVVASGSGLKTIHKELEKIEIQLINEEEGRRELERQLAEDKRQLRDALAASFGSDIPAHDKTLQELANLRAQHSQLTRELEQVAQNLLALGIPQHLANPQDPGTPYDAQEYARLDNRVRDLRSSLERETSKATEFRNQVGGSVKLFNDPSLEDLLTALGNKKTEIETQIAEFRQRILAWLAVDQALQEYQADEMHTIEETLANTGCGRILKVITGKYNNVSLDNNELMVHSEDESYPLASLSTGTQEQVLLAIRLGLLSHVLDDSTSFILLDDAFQHSDWTRREYLIDMVAKLAADGWQILYFTMDDHIRKLFESKVQPILGERYSQFALADYHLAD